MEPHDYHNMVLFVEGVHREYPMPQNDSVKQAGIRDQRTARIEERYPTHTSGYNSAIGYSRELEIGELRQNQGPHNHRVDREKVWYPVTYDDHFSGYRPKKHVASGYNAEIWICDSRFHQRTAVVKYLRLRPQANTEKELSRTLAELQAYYGFYHPNVIRIYSSGHLKADEPEPVPYIAMEYVDGDTLRKWRAEHRTLSEQDAAKIIVVLCGAIQACHEASIIHMDLSPNNVMVAKSDSGAADEKTLKLIDFGAAAVNFVNLGVTTEGFARGDRMNPGHVPSPVDDVFALGCLLYFLVTGKSPSVDNQRHPILNYDSIQNAWLRRICQKATNVDLSSNTYTAAEFSNDLHAWLKDRPIPSLLHEYDKKLKTKLLLKRCFERDNITDNLELTANAAFVLAVFTSLGFFAHFGLLLLGIPSTAAFLFVGNVLSPIVAVVALLFLGIARFQLNSVKIYLPLIALIAAAGLVALWFVPEKPFGPLKLQQMVDVVQYCMLLVGLANVFYTQGVNYSLIPTMAAWGNIILAAVIHAFSDSLIVQQLAPALHWGSETILLISFRSQALKRAAASQMTTNASSVCVENAK